MPLAPGTKLGPYELGALIGAGGMGEVYRARDGRLGRDVAVKVLPPEVAADSDRLRRFAQEAQAVGALNHPNILSVYDLGEQDGVHYLVTELLEGETVRRRLDGGALPARKAIELATQIAHGLAAAHAAGIVHRDLKPENVFVTRDGRVKILDFGLARNVGPALKADVHPVDTAAPTATSPGTVLGTVGYLSPEQVRGEPADHRSDIFSFGAVLYELLTGQRAFRASTGVEIMSAILRQEPDEISRTVPDISPGLDRIVRRCLEKNPDERFQSARDLAYTLGELSHASSGSHAIEGLRTGSRPARRALATAGLVVAVAALAAAGYLLGQRTGSGDLELDYLQLTFRKGTITGARFAPDGQAVVYSASWDGEPSELFTTAPGSPESRPLGLPGAGLLALSSGGDLAVALDQWRLDNFQRGGTLARQPLATSTAPRKLREDVLWADWSPDGSELAVVVQGDGRSRLEYPAGTLLFETEGWLSHPRISPGGDLVAFLEHPGEGDDRGHVAIVDRQGAYRQLGPHWATAWGLAWHPDGKEIWFTAGPDAYLTVRRLNGMTLDGEHRALAVSPGEMTLHDVSRDGRVLLTVEDRRRNLVGRGPDATHERSLTWLDRSVLVDLSSDGRTVLFHEGGRAGGTFGSVYVRRTDGSAAVRLGDGYALGLSADERWAMVFVPRVPREVYLLPLGAGDPRRLGADSPQVPAMRFVGMAAEGLRGVFESRDDGAAPVAVLLDLDTGEGRPLAPAGYVPVAVTGGGRNLVLVGPDGERWWLLPIAGGELRPIEGVEPDERVIQTTGDGTVVYLRRDIGFTARIDRLDRATGRREHLLELEPPDRAGSDGPDAVHLTPDGRHYVFGYTQQLSELYLSRQIR